MGHTWLTSAPNTQGPVIFSTTAEAPAPHVPVSNALAVAVGNENIGPTPQMIPPGPGRGDEHLLLEVSESAVPGPSGPREAADRNDRTRDDAPVLGELEGDHRLKVEIEERPLLEISTGVEVELERQRGQVADRILGSSSPVG
jgi:hypothetical protein